MNIDQSVKNLAIKVCANYDNALNDIKDQCCLELTKGYRCIFFLKDDARCEYFEKAVLPMNPKLEALYKAEYIAEEVGYDLTKKEKDDILEKESSIKGKVKIHCKKCGKTFLADHYNQKYCKFCKRSIRRESTRKAMEKKRKIDVSNVRSETVDI